MAPSISKPSTTKPSLSKSPTPSSKSHSPNSSSLSSHLAMMELKSRILAALSKLADRDTYQIAVDEMEKIIHSLPPEGVPMLLNSLTSELPSPPPAVVRRESVHLLALLAAIHPDQASLHLPRIISHIARRLKDPTSDSSVREACREATGSLAALYVKPDLGGPNAGFSPLIGLFVKPLLEAMGEQSKAVQAGAAACLAKVVECVGAAAPLIAGPLFQKLCPRICKLLTGNSFQAKGAVLSVVSSMSQVGAITPQNMQPILQSVRDCLDNSDWATRKAAADTLVVLASHSSHLIVDEAATTLTTLEASRFDKVKPVRDSITEALSLWKKVTGKDEDDTSQENKGAGNYVSFGMEEKSDHNEPNRKTESFKCSSDDSSPTGSDTNSKVKGGSIPGKAAVLLKKKAPLTDKEINLEFFQKLEIRNPDDFPVEVVLPRKHAQSSNSHNDEDAELIDRDTRGMPNQDRVHRRDSNEKGDFARRAGILNRGQDFDEFSEDRGNEQRGLTSREPRTRRSNDDEKDEISPNDPSASRGNIGRNEGHAEGFLMNSKGNWLAIQRQLSQLERQQAYLMNMLQEFMGGSHESMLTLENRVRGLERVVEEMARDLVVSSRRRGGSIVSGFEGSPNRASSKYNGSHEYSSSKFGWIPFSESFQSSDSIIPGARGKESWRSDSEAWDSYQHGARRGVMGSRRGLSNSPIDSRAARTEHNSQVGSRRAWNKGQGLFRLGEGPSARSVWQASKDEATLEAIRVAGEDNGTSRTARQVPVRELDVEVLGDDNVGQEKGPLWDSWTHALDSLHIGDVDSAYSEVLSTGDDMLLVKLMERSGPVIDQLTNESANEVLHMVGQFVLEQSLYDIALGWLQQLAELSVENGDDFLGIPFKGKKEILLNLHEASAVDVPEDWEGAFPDQIMVQLASVWGINLQQLIKQ